MEEVTLHGGPHDGRRIHIGPAVAARRHVMVADECSSPLALIDEPIKQTFSHYEPKLWADGPTTGPGSQHTTLWRRWTYIGTTEHP